MWGYINDINEIKIPFTYQDAREFNEELAPVKVGGKYGYINKDNVMVIPPQFNNAYPFYHGFGIVELEDNISGFINKSGKVIHMYDQIYTGKYDLWENEGIAYIYKDEQAGVIKVVDQQLKVLVRPQYYDVYKRDKGYYFRDPEFDSNGMYIYTENGVLDENGKVINRQKSRKGEDSSKGVVKGPLRNAMAWICENGLYGFTDEAGEIVIPLQYKEAESFSQAGFAVVKDKTTWCHGIINKEGEYVLPPKYEFIRGIDNMNQVYKIRRIYQEVRIFDAKSKRFIGKEYNDIEAYEDDFIIYTKGGQGLMNSDGQVIVEPYEGFQPEEHKAGYIISKEGEGGLTVRNLQGQKVSNQIYSHIDSPDEYGYRIVKQMNHLGLANEVGNLILPCIFQDIKVMDEDTAVVSVYMEDGNGEATRGPISIKKNQALLRDFHIIKEN